MTREQFIEFVEKAEWVSAKSYEGTAPHQYTTIKKMGDGWRAQFVEVAKFIRDNGFPRKFYRATFWYYAYEGKIYWTMDKVIEETDLVNRADEANKY